jgi:hypothetical protein
MFNEKWSNTPNTADRSIAIFVMLYSGGYASSLCPGRPFDSTFATPGRLFFGSGPMIAPRMANRPSTDKNKPVTSMTYLGNAKAKQTAATKENSVARL